MVRKISTSKINGNNDNRTIIMNEKEINELKDSVHLELAGYLTYKSQGENGINKEDALEIAAHVFADFSLRLMDVYGEPTRERTKMLMRIVNEFYQNALLLIIDNLIRHQTIL